MEYNREELRELAISAPDTIVDLVLRLIEKVVAQADQIEKQTVQIEKLNGRIAELEKQLGRNSRNSSQPPSSDGLKKAKSQRSRGGKKGGQPGHPGKTRELEEHPDVVIEHKPSECSHCGHEIQELQRPKIERRQVFEVKITREITEHQRHSGQCPHCGRRVRGSFPEAVQAPVQYGSGSQSLAVYLMVQQLLPLSRCAEFMNILFQGKGPSESTLLEMMRRTQKQVLPYEAEIRENLLKAPVIHVDETGLESVDKRWLHVISNEYWTLYGVHAKRGFAAIHDIDMLEKYRGIMVHDFWSSYFREELPGRHALCNAHLLRELQSVHEVGPRQGWAKAMQTYLRESWKEVKAARKGPSRQLSEQRIDALAKEYKRIMSVGWMDLAFLKPFPEKATKKGRQKKHHAENLWQRFADFASAILLFQRDRRVPFDNNQAERDLRMMKVKMKISGTFRTNEGASVFASLRSFISTCQKQGRDTLSSLRAVLDGSFSFA